MPSVPNSFAPNTTIESAKVNENFDTVTDAILPTFVFTFTGTLSIGTNVTPALIVNNALTINKAYAYVKTVPTGAAILIDININATSIWNSDQGNRLTVAASAQTGSQTIFDTTALQEGDIITIDIDTIGSSVAGSDLTVELKTT